MHFQGRESLVALLLCCCEGEGFELVDAGIIAKILRRAGELVRYCVDEFSLVSRLQTIVVLLLSA